MKFDFKDGTNVDVKFLTGLGSALAMGISYAFNGGFWWAVFHGLLGWVYLAYKAMTFIIPELPDVG